MTDTMLCHVHEGGFWVRCPVNAHEVGIWGECPIRCCAMRTKSEVGSDVRIHAHEGGSWVRCPNSCALCRILCLLLETMTCVESKAEIWGSCSIQSPDFRCGRIGLIAYIGEVCESSIAPRAPLSRPMLVLRWLERSDVKEKCTSVCRL